MQELKEWNRKEFILKYWICMVLIFTSIITSISYLFDYLQFFDFDTVNNLLINKLLLSRESILISVAAIFIGIYFSIFTILLSIKVDTKIVAMGIKTYKELIQFLKHAFIGAFIYIIYAVLYPLLFLLGKEGMIKFLYELILGLLVLYLLLSALRVGIAFILIFKSDLNMLFSSIENERNQKEEYNEIIYKLKSFLDKHEQVAARKNATELNDLSKIKNPK